MKKLDQLTGWRFIAAFGVILCHFSDLLFPGQPELFLKVWKGMANFVGFFFILSGFILAYNYQSRFLTGKTSIRDFLAARFARIYPALIFSLTIAFPTYLFLNIRTHAPPLDLGLYSLGTLLMVKTWLPFLAWETVSPWNGPTWSIETEFFFYLCFPFLIKPLSKLKLKSNVFVWTSLAAAMTAICFGYDHWAGNGGKEPFHGAFELIHSSPYFCVLEFIFGIVTYNIATQLSTNQLDSLRTKSVWIFPLLITTYLLLNMFMPNMSVFHGLPAIVFSFAILLSYTSPRSMRLLETPKMVYLGEISYSLYLLHIPVRRLFEYGNKAFKPLAALQSSVPQIYALILIGVSLLLAAFCMKVVEDPYRRKLRLLFSKTT